MKINLMKSIDSKKINEVKGRQLRAGDTFSFACHPGVSCFNLCCRNLNLFLYPYDILRLKNRLGIRSDQFLDQYVDVVLRPESHFPEVLLRMSDNDEHTCPFLTRDGCTVYPDRPDTCRSFPVEHGLLWEQDSQKPTMVHFFRPPDFCQGQHEDQTWTLETWAQDQEARLYNKMTAQWAELRAYFMADPWGGEGPEGPKAKMAFMAAYNLDPFREFVFGSSFLKRYKIKRDQLKKLEKDELELLKLGFDWIRFFVWGVKSRRFRLR